MVGIAFNRVVTFDNVKSYSAATKLVTASGNKKPSRVKPNVARKVEIKNSNYEITPGKEHK